MTSSSSPPLECALDTMVLVYSLLQGHPAETACEHLLRVRAGWFTSPLVLFEAKSVLTMVLQLTITTSLGSDRTGGDRRADACQDLRCEDRAGLAFFNRECRNAPSDFAVSEFSRITSDPSAGTSVDARPWAAHESRRHGAQ